MNPAPKNTSMLGALTLIGLGIAIYAFSQSSQEPDRPRGAESVHHGATENPYELPVDELRGTWRGTSYRGDHGIFSASPPIARDENGRLSRSPSNIEEPSATVDFVFDIDDKYLAFKGSESCKATLTYRTKDGEVSESSGMLRIHPPRAPRMREAKPFERADAEMKRRPMGLPSWQVEDRQDNIIFRGAIGDFQVVSWEGGVAELVGEVRGMKDSPLLRQVRVTLRRDSPESADVTMDDSVSTE